MKKKLPKAAMDFFRSEGAKGGKKGASARMEKLTPERRSEIAKKAATARWGRSQGKEAEVLADGRGLANSEAR